MAKSNHLATLDGLRGIAALSVAGYHMSLHRNNSAVVPNAYLAVDFFFALSGFVVAKAYERRLTQDLAFLEFVKIRLIRLYPLLFAAMLASFLIKLTDAWLHHSGIPYKLFGYLVFGLLILPHSVVSGYVMFPLDGVAWSLFAEIVVNIAYAAMIMRLGNRTLCVVIAASGVMLVVTALSNTFGGMNAGLNTGGLGNQILPALVRSCFSFSAGVGIYRLWLTRWFERLPRVSGLWLALALLLSFRPSAFPSHAAYDIGCVLLLYPIILIFGASAHLHDLTARIFLWLGGISYPVYVLHDLIVTNLAGNEMLHRMPAYMADGTTLAVIVLVSWLALIFYDVPCRRALLRALAHWPAGPPRFVKLSKRRRDAY